MLIVLMSVVYASKILNSEIEKQTYDIDFLNVPDYIADSLISELSLEEKLDLIVGFRDSELNYKTDSLVDKAKLEIISSISDTAFLKDYLSIISNQNSNKYYINLNLLKLDSINVNDLNYIRYSINRFKLTKNIFEKNGIYLSLNLSNDYLNHVNKNITKQSKSIVLLDSILKKNLSVINIDYSKSVFNKFEGFEGLLILKFDSLQNNSDLINFIYSNINIIEVEPQRREDIITNLKNVQLKDEYALAKIDLKLKKILKAKYWLEQNENEENIANDSAFNISSLFNYLLRKKSVTVVSDKNKILPLKKTDRIRFNIFSNREKKVNEFFKIFKYYSPFFSYKLDFNKLNKISKSKNTYNIIIVNKELIDSTDGVKLREVFTTLNNENTIILNFSNYENLNYFNDSISVIQFSDNSDEQYRLAAQAIFGGINIMGQLPYNINSYLKYDNKLNSRQQIRLSHSIPEESGLSSEKLNEIDQIAKEGISNGAFPGCQIYVAKNGKVVYNKSFGRHTYNNSRRVKWNDIYDLASVTKIAATTIATMKMIDDRKMKLNDKLAKFFKDKKIDYTRIKPDTVVKLDTFFHNSIINWKDFLKERDTTNISDTSFLSKETVITKLTPKRNIFKVKIKDLLKHKSGIVPAMPIFRYIYYRNEYFKNLRIKIAEIEMPYIQYIKMITRNIPDTIDKNNLLPDSIKLVIKNGLSDLYYKYFSNSRIKDTSEIRIAENLYFKNEYFDTIWRDTKQLPVYSRKVFQYSDVNMILLQFAIDSINKSNIGKYLSKEFFKPLGLKNISYLPLKRFSKLRVIPTEKDNTWRFNLLHGYVHDPSASLIGGMAGNAGLYSNAYDLGVLFQMVLKGGTYGGKHYLKKKSIEKFTKRLDDTQRALGFDMPNRKAIVGRLASSSTYGHSGYTGTCVWVDPESELVYVFLSNRNHPNSKNWKIVNLKIRERIHDAIYKSIINN